MASAVSQDDRMYLQAALELAQIGRFAVSPNPMVGCVIARDGQNIGEGFHGAVGGPHAERAALLDCRERGNEAAGATVYVTLEPCAHHGRTPPCTDALIEARVARIVYLTDDPSDKASGKGPSLLREAGIEVEHAEGSLSAEARLLNQPFFKHARTGQPLVIVKRAMSLDGATAADTGDSKWISGEESRELVHRWRSEVDAIAVGSGTVEADDPLLTARPAGAGNPRQPIRVVFDGHANLPVESQLVRSIDKAGVIVVARPDQAPPARVDALRERGVDVIHVESQKSGPSTEEQALKALGARGITSLLVEGGSFLAGSMLEEMDELRLFVAPIVLGGSEYPVFRTGVEFVSEGLRPLAMSREEIGDDLLITARMKEW